MSLKVKARKRSDERRQPAGPELERYAAILRRICTHEGSAAP